MKLRHIPNIITGLRLLLIIPFLVILLKGHYSLALYLFVLGGITDLLDGMLARLCGWKSRVGAIADPIADKLLLVSAFVALAWLDLIPWWLMLLVVIRDIWIMSGALAYRYFISHLDFAPTLISKINTNLQFLFVILMLMHLSLWELSYSLLVITMWAVMATSVLSLLHYTWVWGSRGIKMRSLQKFNATTNVSREGQ